MSGEIDRYLLRFGLVSRDLDEVSQDLAEISRDFDGCPLRNVKASRDLA